MFIAKVARLGGAAGCHRLRIRVEHRPRFFEICVAPHTAGVIGESECREWFVGEVGHLMRGDGMLNSIARSVLQIYEISDKITRL